MSSETLVESNVKTKKQVWTEPVVTVIDLDSARHGSASVDSDSGSNHKS